MNLIENLQTNILAPCICLKFLLYSAIIFTAREVWKKKYYEAKKQTPALETDCQKSRAELDSIHKKYLAALENNKLNTKQKVCVCSVE